MVLEIADISVRSEAADDFTLALREGLPLFSKAAGLHSVRLTHCIETPTRFVLLLEWDDVDAHIEFRGTADFARWREIVAPFFDGPPRTEHFSDIAV